MKYVFGRRLTIFIPIQFKYSFELYARFRQFIVSKIHYFATMRRDRRRKVQYGKEGPEIDDNGRTGSGCEGPWAACIPRRTDFFLDP